MSQEPDPKDDRESEAVRDLVKRALATETATQKVPDILRAVQRRIRVRSRGKFFADGWSTTQARQAYLLMAIVTMLLVVLAYYALLPMDIH
jgi:type II secretory pathway component PulM